MINALVCVDNNWAIGKKNGLLFNIKADMKYFRENTKEKEQTGNRKNDMRESI